jgi:hypothetical protein
VADGGTLPSEEAKRPTVLALESQGANFGSSLM